MKKDGKVAFSLLWNGLGKTPAASAESKNMDPNIKQTKRSPFGFQELSYQKRNEGKYSESNVPIPNQI